MASPVYLYLFGSFRLEDDSHLIRLPTRKVESLLAYLALYPEPHAREKLAALFWGDVSDEQARGSLRKALTLLRQPLGADIILADRQTVQLNPDYPLWVDAGAFRQLAVNPQQFVIDERLVTDSQLLSVLDLYQGDLLVEFYDDWILPLREQYRAIYLETLLNLTQEMRTRSEYTQAIGFAQKVLSVDASNERAHQHLMFCYLASGNRNAALKQYEACARLLDQELAVEPMPETVALYRWLKQAPVERPAMEALITNLPLPLSSFIGREREMAEVKRLLKVGGGREAPASVRLLTLTGPGGSGKTRLAIQIATDLIDLFPDGVWWVELASLGNGFHIPQAIAKTLGVREVPDEPLITSLITFLRPRQLLLVLDNCEHLITACAQLAEELLNHCPQLKLFTTSREALGLPGEQLFPVPTLAVPRREVLSLADLMLEFEGIRLFVERARAVQPGFALTEQNALFVSQICGRLDGIPLAIELAATRIKTLAVEEMAAWLNDRFNLLAMGRRTAPSRHQTLRSVLDWSYELLPETEQILFRRLSVFAGRFTLEMIGPVCAGEGLNESGQFELLSRLVDKSLVMVEPVNGQTYYQMLETIRAYAREKLDVWGEAGRLHNRHLDLFVALAERAEIELRGPAQSRWLEQLDMAVDNLRTALEWSLAGDVQQGLRLAGALAWFWNLRGYWHEGPSWLSRFLAAPNASARTPGRAKTLVAAGNLTCWGSNDYPTAARWLEESIAIYRELQRSDRWGLGYALSLYGEVLTILGDSTKAQNVLDESLAIGEGLGEAGKWICAWALMSLGKVADTPPSLAQARFERSVALFRELGDKAQLSVVLANLAWFYIGQKNYTSAQATTVESLTLTEEIGDIMGAAWMLKLSGDLALAQANYAQAASYYQASLDRFKALGSKSGIAETLADLGQVRLAEGDPAAAQALWKEALPLFEEIGQQDAYARLLRKLGQLKLGSPGD
jgi:predicted ATPase/DNA-binding SARP family transcriptional activator